MAIYLVQMMDALMKHGLDKMKAPLRGLEMANRLNETMDQMSDAVKRLSTGSQMVLMMTTKLHLQRAPSTLSTEMAHPYMYQ